MIRGRFAPSPTGYLHLGHAFSALTAWQQTRAAGGEFLLRIEDIDQSRARPAFEAAIFDDLHWLGLAWPRPVMRQSQRGAAYTGAINQLISMGLCYPCGCTRRDIENALGAPQEGAAAPDAARVYPGTCRHRPIGTRTGGDALRLNMGRAIACLGGGDALGTLGFRETGGGSVRWHYLDADTLAREIGDIVLARRDIGTSYHLSVVVDDAAQGITQVTRGRDMQGATMIHRLLQALLNLPTPDYHHHRLIRDENGKRLAKRDDARAIRAYRASGLGPADIRARLGLDKAP